MCSGCSATAPRIDCPISSSCITTEPSFGTLRRPWIDFLEDFGGADRRQGLLVVLTLCSCPFSRLFKTSSFKYLKSWQPCKNSSASGSPTSLRPTTSHRRLLHLRRAQTRLALQEALPFHLPQLSALAGGDRRGAGHAVEQRQLSEGVAGA